ncbi:TetR/AcrR family transcriptional regulator [Nonomuraea jabiensis]|uniref:AcrR family transcriptional regulator n=1 Tax=Nonomuraea jabiensis TaxID=882448 RepID=A0A7W9GH17_9ACTN|nr:TetR/AcrR family transcriptional regulator [Nonomuraea jabiensis]MBB5783669.1 AcrR family transcriptional regulator [Nonomuraea jabiensis]
MPKIVDHEARRRHIADAVHRLIDAKGLDSVSLREVAAEAGISMGAVQYYFSTKDEMLLLALEHLNTRIRLRVASADQSDPLALLRVAILELLPLDENRRSESRIGLAFLARSVVADEVAEPLRAGLPYVMAFYIDQIRAAQAAGQVAADLDAEKEASILFAFAQGMVHPTLVGHYSPEAVVAAVDYHLDRLRAR